METDSGFRSGAWHIAATSREKRTTTLYRTSADGNVSEVKHLIVVGTDVNAKNDSSFTPLRIAKLFKHARTRPRF